MEITGQTTSAPDAATAATDGLLDIRNVVKIYRGRRVVNDVSVYLRKGEVVGLLGPNGAGKTTTLKLMLGLLRPDAGEIRLFGRPPSDPMARARVGYLPENPYFYDYLTAVEFLDFYGRLQGIPAAERGDRVRETLKHVGLEGRGVRAAFGGRHVARGVTAPPSGSRAR